MHPIHVAFHNAVNSCMVVWSTCIRIWRTLLSENVCFGVEVPCIQIKYLFVRCELPLAIQFLVVVSTPIQVPQASAYVRLQLTCSLHVFQFEEDNIAYLWTETETTCFRLQLAGSSQVFQFEVKDSIAYLWTETGNSLFQTTAHL